ncbi:MAG: 16S rRNA (guanine(966)-N(2))-methyltransferase RsmD [Bacilli bacterium]|nr:16S rRNA (guanine(966)-N(2))-methyltransferase RsmD [Bacilli bacterium]
MRVVAGLYRHRELLMPKGKNTRPSKDIVKEGFFSALGELVQGATVLDLFAGSGALGIEAISRGAKLAYLVDHDREALKTIRTNLDNLEITNAKVLSSDYSLALAQFKNDGIKFDLVILDPPYQLDVIKKIVQQLVDDELLSKQAVIVIESEKEIKLDITFTKVRDYRYGRTLIKILWR